MRLVGLRHELEERELELQWREAVTIDKAEVDPDRAVWAFLFSSVIVVGIAWYIWATWFDWVTVPSALFWWWAFKSIWTPSGRVLGMVATKAQVSDDTDSSTDR